VIIKQDNIIKTIDKSSNKTEEYSVPYEAPVISAKPKTVITRREIDNFDMSKNYGSKRIFLPDTTIRMEVNYALEQYPEILETIIEFITVLEKFNNLSEAIRRTDIIENRGYVDNLQELGYFPEVFEKSKANLGKKGLNIFLNPSSVFNQLFHHLSSFCFTSRSKFQGIKERKVFQI